MSVIEKAAGLLEVLRPTDVQALSPAQRRRFADLCRYLGNLADLPTAEPKAGVLGDLHRGNRAH